MINDLGTQPIMSNKVSEMGKKQPLKMLKVLENIPNS